MRPVSIVLIGDFERPEFYGVTGFLESLGQVHRFRDAEAATQALASDEIGAELTVIAQSYPGEFSHPAVDRLRAASPVSRIVALLGSWCEGEMRSGQPWPAVIRLYWHQGLGRIAREIGRLAEGDCPSWGLPLTATEEERLLAESRTGFQGVATGQRPVLRSGLVGIASRRLESYDWLSAACRQHGSPTVWLRGPQYPRVEGLAAILIDGTDFGDAEMATLRQLSERYSQARCIALMDFPRIEDRRCLLQAGAAAVLSKPLNVEDLIMEIEE
jgi:hypothetical protein